MSILDDLFEGDEFNPRQVLSDELVKQTMDLIPRLVAIRESKNLSQAQVAKRMGISRPGVAQLERHDSNPTLSTIRRYALAMNALVVIEACDGEPWADQKVQDAKDPDLYDKMANKWYIAHAASRGPLRYSHSGARIGRQGSNADHHSSYAMAGASCD
ncbi:helix-turn-helix domain-containing protein [Micrococcus luteus]|uniref:helix-turn-helix domain-containing protein n=1 Tax=Micrococcus luteus TaxID=1270 RepID=UPI00288EE484|nr:helix-turn-helix transcriptional regulator [Micrococcus luteus]MDT1991434.1 helix-turn-helix transcriptional regulator [Micrococcus luteus]